jgi:hypothetical protein
MRDIDVHDRGAALVIRKLCRFGSRAAEPALSSSTAIYVEEGMGPFDRQDKQAESGNRDDGQI